MGRRTLTRAICFLNLQFQDWSAHYKLFSRGKWEPGDLFKPVIEEAVPRYCRSFIAVAFDDTVLKRTGKNLSTHFRAMVTGLRASFDDAGYAAKILVAVVDGSYCNTVTFAKSLGERIALLARCRKDIRLCLPAPEGSRRVYGEKTFTPEEVAKDKTVPWRKTRIFHGGRFRKVHYKEVTRVLWQGGGKRRLLRLFVIRPVAYRKTKKGRLYYRQRAYPLCDDLALSPRELLQSYFDRWEIEVNHRDEKDILGVGQSQVWAA